MYQINIQPEGTMLVVIHDLWRRVTILILCTVCMLHNSGLFYFSLRLAIMHHIVIVLLLHLLIVTHISMFIICANVVC